MSQQNNTKEIARQKLLNNICAKRKRVSGIIKNASNGPATSHTDPDAKLTKYQLQQVAFDGY